MADQTVADLGNRFDLTDASDARRLTYQALAILRAVRIAIDAQEDGAVSYSDNVVQRWLPAVDAARSRLGVVRDLLMEKPYAPPVDWYTSLNLIEAMSAALWHSDVGGCEVAFESEDMQACADAAIDSLDSMCKEINNTCNSLETRVVEVDAQA